MLDVLCAHLVRRHVPVTEQERDLLARTLDIAGGRTGEKWVDDAEGTIAALTVVS